MRSFVASAKRADTRWHVIDAGGQVLGRVATVTVRLLQGKHKATYTPFIDTGDHVVIVNAAKVKLTGRKDEQKLYRRHSGRKAVVRPLSSDRELPTVTVQLPLYNERYVVERLIDKDYQVCIVDPEGDYGTLEGVVALGNPVRAPNVSEILGILEDPKVNLSINLRWRWEYPSEGERFGWCQQFGKINDN